MRPGDLLRVNVSDGQAADSPIFSHHVNAAPIGKMWNGEAREDGQRHFVIE